MSPVRGPLHSGFLREVSAGPEPSIHLSVMSAVEHRSTFLDFCVVDEFINTGPGFYFPRQDYSVYGLLRKSF